MSTSRPGSPGCSPQQNVCVSELSPVAVDLESVFLELTGTAPVEGEHRQVDQSAMAPATGAREGGDSEPLSRGDRAG